MRTPHLGLWSQCAESWALGGAVAGGSEGVGESEGAVGGGEEVLELLVGQFGCEGVGVVVGPPVGEFAQLWMNARSG